MSQRNMMDSLIIKMKAIDQKLELINAKTDLLFLSVLTSHANGSSDTIRTQMMTVLEEQNGIKKKNPDDPKVAELGKVYAAMRMQIEMLDITSRASTLSMERLMLNLSPEMEKRHPALGGDFYMKPPAKPMKPAQKPAPKEEKKDEQAAKPTPVPPVRTAP